MLDSLPAVVLDLVEDFSVCDEVLDLMVLSQSVSTTPQDIVAAADTWSAVYTVTPQKRGVYRVACKRQ